MFQAAGMEVLEGPARHTDEMIALLKHADGALVNIQPATTREVLESCPHLKVVSRMGVGVDSIDLDAASELGVLACNVPGVNTSEVADHAMALLLSLTRCVHDAALAVRSGAWRGDRSRVDGFHRLARRIAGHIVGIIGFGNIGRAFATRVRGFGPANIIAWDPYVSQLTADLCGVRMVGLEELLRTSHFVSIHCSATAETRHLINASTLSKMLPSAYLVNTSRGEIVDGAALATALESGEIAGAALDVTETEPIAADDPLLTLPNAIVTPHIAGSSPTFLEECPILQAENVIRVLSGLPPHGLANPEVLKTIAVMRATDPGRWAGVAEFSLSHRV